MPLSLISTCHQGVGEKTKKSMFNDKNQKIDNKTKAGMTEQYEQMIEQFNLMAATNPALVTNSENDLKVSF